MTRALGHNKKSGNSISYTRIEITKHKSYRIIVASDGFWDVTDNIDVANFY